MREGWEMKSLGDVCDILDSKRKPITKRNRIPGDIPYYGATGVLSYVKDYLFDEQLVLLGEDGAKWESGDNSAFIINGKTWVNNHAHVLRPKRNILDDYWLVYNLNFQNLMPFISGMTVPKLNQGNMRKIQIPIPPLPEQKQIVAILDKAFAAIDQAQAKIEKNIENAKELFQSKINKVFDSFLNTKESRKLEDLLDILTDYHANGSYKVLKKNVELRDEEDYAWMVRSTDFEKEFNGDFKYIDEHAYNYLKKSKIFGGEVIISKIGNAGKVYLMPEIERPCSLAMNLFLLRLKKEQMTSEYLYYYLKSTKGEAQILSKLNGTTTKTITKASVRELTIPFIELELQVKTIKEFQKLEIEIGRIIELFENKLLEIEDLKKSILQKAFSGELTQKPVVAKYETVQKAL
jgi:type I restriction enzyme S subunit